MIMQTLPKGFVMRRPTMEDVEAVLQLVQADEIAHENEIETTLSDMRRWWQMPNFDLATDAWLIVSPENQIVAFADLSHEKHVRLHPNATIHRAYLHRGIGTYLLQLQELRAQQHLPLAEADARVTMVSWLNSKDQETSHLLEQHGFKRIRSSYRMAIELTEQPASPVWAEGITLHTLAEDTSLLRAVYEADEDAFQDHWGYLSRTFAEFQHWESERENFDPTLWFLAMDGAQIAGIGLCADEKEQGGWVHSLGVRRLWRQQGIGMALLRYAFGEFYRRGIRKVYLGVDAQSLTGATRLYERAGMHVVKQYNIYEKELRAGKELSTQLLEN